MPRNGLASSAHHPAQGDAGFTMLPSSDPDDAPGTAGRAVAVEATVAAAAGRTPAQKRWMGSLALSLGVDACIASAFYLIRLHGRTPRETGDFASDTVDLVHLAAVRLAVTLALTAVALVRGIPAKSSLAPHKRSPADRRLEEQALFWRRGALVACFAFLTACSVFTGAKCVVFAFPDPATERRLAPLLGATIFLVNVQVSVSPIKPLQNCSFAAESQWQSRGKCRF
jgi:hypothetical protein